MGLLIQDEAVVAKVTDLAKARGQTPDQIIADAVDRIAFGSPSAHPTRRLHGEELRKAVAQLQAEFAALPVRDPNFTIETCMTKTVCLPDGH